MFRCVKLLGVCVIACPVVSLLGGTSVAGTIIRLGLGSDAQPDIEFDGTTLSTFDDGIAGTTEDQNTNVDFQGFVAAHAAGIPTATASISLNGLVAEPPATVILNTLVIQNFSGGTFILRDAANNELLSGTLGGSSIAGTLGGSGTGGLFTTSFSSVNPTGSLAQYIMPNSLTMSMSFTSVVSNSVTGFALQPTEVVRLAAFTGDVTINIAAEPIPEPATRLLLVVGMALAAAVRRRS